jgi:cytoskeletal protein CcmA (bactofilin family)
MKGKRSKTNRAGTALLVVLFIVMAITILSLGFLSRSDVELACGENMILRTQMDYLAESGLEHARGLILNDSNFSENWTALRQPLYSGNDYYDVNAVQLGECNYKIICDAYREKDGERTGRSSLEAELRLDPCIAFWTQAGTTISNNVTINGDVYCNGTLTNNGTINGDVFASSLGGSGSIKGRRKATEDLSLTWPRITVEDFISHYSPVQTIEANSLENTSIGGSAAVCYSDDDLEVEGSVQIEGMLIVDANLTVTGNGNVITAGENFPAMLVTGNLIIENGGHLSVNGLAVVNEELQTSGDADITGGLFVGNGITGAGSTTITAAPSKTAIVTWSEAGTAERWGQASGAFFKSIKRK